MRYRFTDGVDPRLQRVLDSLDASPSIIKTATWDVVAWNRAAAVVLTDYTACCRRASATSCASCSATRPSGQNSTTGRASRARLASEVGDLVDDLCRVSPEFDRMWRENHVFGHSEGQHVKRMLHPEFGAIDMEYSLFAVDGRPDLSMLVYTPLDARIAKRIRNAVASIDKSPDDAPLIARSRR